MVGLCVLAKFSVLTTLLPMTFGVRGNPSAETSKLLPLQTASSLDDGDVIQAALLAIIKSDYWDWPEGSDVRYAILGTQFKSSKRPGFSDLLQREIGLVRRDIASRYITLNHPPLGQRELGMLNALKGQCSRGNYHAPKNRQLSFFTWAKQILLATPGAYGPGAKPRLRKADGFLTACLPAYSPNGGACILDIERPWGSSMIETDTFLLRRRKKRWVVMYMSVARPL